MKHAFQYICRDCDKPVCKTDLFCGFCKASLTNLEWSSDGINFNDTPIFPIGKGSDKLDIHFKNAGVVPISLRLSKQSLQHPQWISTKNVQQLLQNISNTHLLPGQTDKISIAFQAEELHNKMSNFNAIGNKENDNEYTLFFRSTKIITSQDKYKEKIFSPKITLSREPYAQPEGTIYRFLPWEHFDEHGNYLKNTNPEQQYFEHTVRVYNHTTAPIIVFLAPNNCIIDYNSDIAITFDINSDLLHRIPSTDIVHIEPFEPFELQVRESREITFYIKPPKDDKQMLSYFSTSVEFAYRTQNEEKEGLFSTIIAGVLGKGPSLKIRTKRTRFPNARSAEPVILENQGHLPLTLKGFTTYRLPIRQYSDTEEIDRGRATVIDDISEDWLDIINPKTKESSNISGIIIPPESEHHIGELTFNPVKRPKEEESKERCRRIIRFHHDGLQNSCDLDIDVELGKIENPKNIILAIDFGTSNSMAQIIRNEANEAYSLYCEKRLLVDNNKPFPKNIRQTQVPSYILAEPKKSTLGFTYKIGNEVKTQRDRADIQMNILRSMKTIINKDPTTTRSFNSIIKKQNTTVDVPMQELLNSFIKIMKERAEEAIGYMDPNLKEKTLHLDRDSIIRFDRAIFTHPISAEDNSLRALYTAAQKCGLNQNESFEEFKEKNCIDESSASLIAFIHQAYQNTAIPDEGVRIMCFDCGGGTTDITTATIRKKITKVTTEFFGEIVEQDFELKEVELHVKKGEVFGGDDIDKFIAHHVLDELTKNTKVSSNQPPKKTKDKKEKNENTPHFDFPEKDQYWIKRALDLQNPEDLLKTYERENPQLLDTETNKKTTNQYHFFAQQLIDACERWKIELSSQDSNSTFIIPSFFNVQKWCAPDAKIDIPKNLLETIIQKCLAHNIKILDRIMTETPWDWSELDVFLFTGQTTKLQALRSFVMEQVKLRGQNKKLKFINEGYVIDQKTKETFDVKGCVTLGACIYAAKTGSIKLIPPGKTSITFDVLNSFSKTIKGLEQGNPFPSQGIYVLPSTSYTFSLYNSNNDEFAVVSLDTQQQAIRVIMESMHEIYAELENKQRIAFKILD